MCIRAILAGSSQYEIGVFRRDFGYGDARWQHASVCAPGSAGNFTHTGLTNGLTYHYSAFAVDESGNAAPAATASAIPAEVLLPPPPPGNLDLN